ncbi:MAG TPA: hypothetical protein VGH33_04670 [Isosphaeraceae bacterium]|jgi:hypothetical protein
MRSINGRFEADAAAVPRQVLPMAGDAEEWMVRARVRAILKGHGRLVGEPWYSPAFHAERAVAEVIEVQGLEAGVRWAQSLAEQLAAERRAAGVPDGDGQVVAMAGSPRVDA